MAKTKQRLPLTALEQDVLTLLRGKKLYGLQIMQAIKEVGQGSRTIKVGSLYPLLAQMESKGYLVHDWSEERSAGGKRKYYEITPAGEDILQDTNDFRYILARWKG